MSKKKNETSSHPVSLRPAHLKSPEAKAAVSQTFRGIAGETGLGQGEVDQTSYELFGSPLLEDAALEQLNKVSGIMPSPKKGVGDTQYVPIQDKEGAEIEDPFAGLQLPPRLPAATDPTDPARTQQAKWVPDEDPFTEEILTPSVTSTERYRSPRHKLRLPPRTNLPPPDQTQAMEWEATAVATDATPADVAATQYMVAPRDEPTDPDSTRPEVTQPQFDRSHLGGDVGKTQFLSDSDREWVEGQQPLDPEGFRQVALVEGQTPKTNASFGGFEAAMAAPAHLGEDTQSSRNPLEPTAPLAHRRPTATVAATQQLAVRPKATLPLGGPLEEATEELLDPFQKQEPVVHPHPALPPDQSVIVEEGHPFSTFVRPPAPEDSLPVPLTREDWIWWSVFIGCAIAFLIGGGVNLLGLAYGWSVLVGLCFGVAGGLTFMVYYSPPPPPKKE